MKKSNALAFAVLALGVGADDVKRMPAMKPAAIGLAVPGMPPGSAGMEAGNRKDPYDVFLIDRSGRETLFAHYQKL